MGVIVFISWVQNCLSTVQCGHASSSSPPHFTDANNIQLIIVHLAHDLLRPTALVKCPYVPRRNFCEDFDVSSSQSCARLDTSSRRFCSGLCVTGVGFLVLCPPSLFINTGLEPAMDGNLKQNGAHYLIG